MNLVQSSGHKKEEKCSRWERVSKSGNSKKKKKKSTTIKHFLIHVWVFVYTVKPREPPKQREPWFVVKLKSNDNKQTISELQSVKNTNEINTAT